jgi:hypothetical protein
MMGAEWHWKEREDALEIWHGQECFTVYKFAPEQYRPWFYPVTGPSGRSVTREVSEPYPHHRSLWLGHGNVNGHEIWLEGEGRGRIRHEGFEALRADAEEAFFKARSVWLAATGEAVMRDERAFRFFVREGKRYIEADLSFWPVDGPLTLGRTNHAFFAVRVVESISVEGGGRITNAEGGLDEEGTFGQRSAWCDYSGPVTPEGTWNGIAILDHPQNPWHPSPWFTRDYGFMSPAPFYWEEYTIPRGGVLRLRYLVVVHAGDAQEANIAGDWEWYRKRG